MNKFYVLNLFKVACLQIFLFIMPNIIFAQNCAKVPQVKNNDHLVYPYINSMFSMDDCTDSDIFKFKMQTSQDPSNWQDMKIALGNSIYVNLLADPQNNGKYLLEPGGSTSQNSYIVNDILLFPETYNNLLCLSYPTIDGPVPLICKIYTANSGNSNNNDPSGNTSPCETGDYSMYSLNFSGRAIHCIRDSLEGVFFRNSLSTSSIANFADFQNSLQQAIFAALLLYIVFFGIKLLLEPSQASPALFVKFVLKFLLVLYFSVGLNIISWNGTQKIENGFIKQGLPFLTSMSWSLADLVLNSSGGGDGTLCDFSNITYKPGMEFYRVWDSIDCRLFTYLGVTSPEIKGSNSGPNSLVEKYALKFLIVLGGLFLGGNILFVIAAIIFLVFFLSLILFFISTFCVYLITLYAMAYISPIFIPMALFEKTKPYFDGWLRISISCALQPAILAGFIALILTMYDQVIYDPSLKDQCLFTAIKDGNGKVQRFDFTVESNCTGSFGYKMIKYYSGEGWDKLSLLITDVSYLNDTLNASTGMLYVMFFCIIGYFFSQSLTSFSASITGGPNVGDVSIGPMALVNYLTRKISSGKDNKETEPDLSDDTFSKNNDQSSKDTFSKNNDQSSDSLSK